MSIVYFNSYKLPCEFICFALPNRKIEVIPQDYEWNKNKIIIKLFKKCLIAMQLIIYKAFQIIIYL